MPSVATISVTPVKSLALQTDVIGVPWLAYVVWVLAGSAATLAADVASRSFATRPS